METYLQIRDRHLEEGNAFPMVFAFNNKQFAEGMEKLGLKVTDTDKVYKLDGGAFYRKTDSQKLKDLLERHEKEMTEAIESDTTGEGFIFDMFNYELANHEYCITGDIEPTLETLGFTLEDIKKDPKLIAGLKKGIANQRDDW